MSEIDYMLKKIFSNFYVSQKSVEKYTLYEPFSFLEHLKQDKYRTVGDAGLEPATFPV